MPSQMVFVPGDQTLGVPNLGDGYDAVGPTPADASRLRAINFTSTPQAGSNIQAYATELKQEDFASSDVQNTLNGSYQNIISASYGVNSIQEIYQSNSLFYFIAYVIKSSSQVNHDATLKLLPGMLSQAQQDAADFRAKYGFSFVDGVDFGGTALFFYMYNTTDTTTRNQINAGLNAAYNNQLKVSDALSTAGVSTSVSSSCIAKKVVSGGDNTIFLALNPMDFGQSTSNQLLQWGQSVGTSNRIRLRVTPYQDPLGFGPPPAFPDLTGNITF